MEDNEPRRSRDVRISLTEEEARTFLDRLATDAGFRDSVEQNPRATLLEYRIDLGAESVPETVTLPSPEQITQFVEAVQAGNYLGPRPSAVLGWAILHIVLGAMPLVAADD